MSMTSELVQKIRLYEKTYAESPFHKEIEGTAELLRKSADTIEELSLKLHNSQMERSSMYYNGGWIPCDERMPTQPKENKVFDYKPIELYLVYVKGSDYPFRAFWNGKFFTDEFTKVQGVAYWMPLPLPPKHEQKED